MIEEIAPGVHSIDAPFEGVPLTVYAIVDEDSVTLIDCGIASTPDQHLAPALQRIGFSLSAVRVIATTHGHHDHHGGIAAVRAASPRVVVTAPGTEAAWIESTERYLLQTFAAAFPGQFDLPAAAAERIRRLAGPGAAVDIALRGSDRLQIGRMRPLDVTWTPGHSPGHVTFHDHPTSLLATGDALLGDGFERDGQPVMFPLYTSVSDYVGSVRTIEAIDAELVCTAHHGVLHRPAARRLIEVSLAFTERLEAVTAAELRDAGALNIIEAVAAVEPHYPHAAGGSAMAETVAAHLDHLVAGEQATARIVDGVKYWSSL